MSNLSLLRREIPLETKANGATPSAFGKDGCFSRFRDFLTFIHIGSDFSLWHKNHFAAERRRSGARSLRRVPCSAMLADALAPRAMTFILSRSSTVVLLCLHPDRLDALYQSTLSAWREYIDPLKVRDALRRANRIETDWDKARARIGLQI